MTEGLKCLKFWTEYTRCGVLAWRKIYAKSARKMLQRKRLHHKKQINWGFCSRNIKHKGEVSLLPLRKCNSIVWISVMLLLAY